MSDLQQVHEAIEAIRKEFETKGKKLDQIDWGKVDKIEADLKKFEDDNAKMVLEAKEAKQREIELKERLEGLEVELVRRSTGEQKDNYKELPEYKAMNELCKRGFSMLGEEIKANLRTDNDTQGGFLVPVELDSVIIKKITEISGVRQVARVRTTTAKTLEMPVRATIPAAVYEGETETGTDSTSTYESESVTTYRQTFSTPVTIDMLNDAAFDMESEILVDASEAFAKGEGLNFVKGDGVKKPAGFTADSRVQAAARASGVASSFDADDVLLLTGDLKTGYNPTYALNRRTLAFIRTLKSTDGVFLWQPGLNGVVVNTLAGFPYVIMEDMPDIATNAFPIAFGDFLRGYTIVDRTGMSVIRDELTLKKKAIIEFTMNRWNTGKVVLPEAIKLLKTTP